MKRNVEVNPVEEIACLLARARVATPGTSRSDFEEPGRRYSTEGNGPTERYACEAESCRVGCAVVWESARVTKVETYDLDIRTLGGLNLGCVVGIPLEQRGI